MKRSSSRILTTHAGSLPWLAEDAPTSDAQLREAVAGVVARHREIGLDMINEGEYTSSSTRTSWHRGSSASRRSWAPRT